MRMEAYIFYMKPKCCPHALEVWWKSESGTKKLSQIKASFKYILIEEQIKGTGRFHVDSMQSFA